MNITVNEKSIAYILNEKNQKNELINYLNDIIDIEIEKENPDTDLLDDCTEFIFALESGDLTSYISADNMLKLCKKSINKNNRRVRQIAAAIMIILVASGALLQTNPAIAQQTRELINHIAYVLGISADETETGKSEIVSIYAKTKEDATFTVSSEDDIHPDDISIIAVDKYNYERQIPLSECKISKKYLDSSHIMVIYSYEGCACSIIYNLEVTS